MGIAILPNSSSDGLYSNFASSLLDTSSLYYYSFALRKTVKLKELVDDANSTFMKACDGSKMIFTAPNYGVDARYEWEGPNGFKAYTQDVKLTNIQSKDEGIYSVSVIKPDVNVYGKIKLEVKELPVVRIKETSFLSGLPVHLEVDNFRDKFSYTWQNSENQKISKLKDLWLPAHSAGNYAYKLTVENEGCKEILNFVIEVRDKTTANVSFNLFDTLRKGE
jgi:hypothetical protein